MAFDLRNRMLQMSSVHVLLFIIGGEDLVRKTEQRGVDVFASGGIGVAIVDDAFDFIVVGLAAELEVWAGAFTVTVVFG